MFTMQKCYGVFIGLGFFLLMSLFIFPVYSPAEEKKPIIIRYAHQQPEAQGVAKRARFFERRVKEESKGNVIIEVYPAAQLFGARELFPAVRRGAVEISAPVSGSIQGAIPLIEIFHMPFLYENLDMVTKTWYGYPGEIIKKEMEKMGVKFLAEGYFGWSTVCNSKREIKKPEDLRGLKIRTAGPLDADVMKILGATPVVMGGDEAYLAMARKTVDGSFTGPTAMTSRNYWDVQKYVTIISLTYTSIPILINLNFWNGLTKDTQDLLQQCAKESEKMILNLTLQDIKDSEEILRKNGMIVYFPTASELEEFRKATQPIIDDWVKQHGEVAAKMVEFVRNLR